MGVKKHVTYETIERKKCYILLREAFIVTTYHPDIDLDYDVPKVLGVFSSEEKAKANAKLFIAKHSLMEAEKNIGGWPSKTYMDIYGNIITLSILEKELDADIDEMYYSKIITLRNL